MKQSRNVLVESARITRGNIKPLTELNVENYDALFIPGGFGAAKNLSNFATKAADMTVDPKVEEIMLAFSSHKK